MANKLIQKNLFVILLALCGVQTQNIVSNVTNGNFYQGEECYRPCKDGDRRICYFKFVLENYQAMGAACGRCAQGVINDCFNVHCLPMDGIERGLMSINRKIPGPSIQVCKDDQIVVDVVNKMLGTTSTIHWHGLHMRATPWMDGVPFVTQCPIDFGTTFRYSFRASEPGTQFYHSHSGHHKLNGHYGPLTIRMPEEQNPHRQLYDYDIKEHSILLSDWNHNNAEMFTPGLPTKKPGIGAENVLINGRGVYKEGTKSTTTPIEVFKVKAGGRYRFRLINSASHVCPAQIQVQGHNMTIIATDSFDVKPMVVDTFVSLGGERYDFIINADKLSGNFCIKVRLIGHCALNCPSCEQYAILSYIDKDATHKINVSEYADYSLASAKCYSEMIIAKTTLNHPSTNCYERNSLHKCSGDLAALNADPNVINAPVDQRIYFAFNSVRVPTSQLFVENRYQQFINLFGQNVYQATINRISFHFPPISVLTQTDQLTDEMFCNSENLPAECANGEICHCTHRIKIKLNSTVELVIVDEQADMLLNHPFHVHGVAMHVVGMGKIPNVPMTVPLFKQLERRRSLPPMPKDHQPPLKDTLALPTRGYTILKFRANNPGFWLMHCHFEYHLGAGMAVVLQVGEPSDFVKSPSGFPTCGNFVPDIDQNL